MMYYTILYVVTFSRAGSHFWTGGHIVSNIVYKDIEKQTPIYGVCFFIIMIIKTRTFRVPKKRKLFGKRRSNAMSDK